MTQEPASPELSAFQSEMERLSVRPLSRAEELLALRTLTTRSVWIDGLRPESLAQSALALASAARKSVLFVSPSESTWEDRKFRLGPRGPWRSIDRKVRTQVMTQNCVVSITPDSLLSPVVARALGPNGPDFIFIEEAHALSCRSGSYRPSLLNIAIWLRRFPQATLVCAATASDAALREDVAQALRRPDLGLAQSRIQAPVLGDTPAIRLEVQLHDGPPPTARIAELPRPAVVLCATPAQADQIFAQLEAQKVPTHRYHSGLSESERAKELLHFALPGRRAVLVAVSAFGPNAGFEGTGNRGVPEDFGRDYLRRDVRSIVHLCAPCSLRQYANELSLLSPTSSASPLPAVEDATEFDEEPDHGPATAVLFFDSAHLMLNHALLKRKRPSPEALQGIVDWLSRQSSASSGKAVAGKAAPSAWIDRAELAKKVGGSLREMEECLRFLIDGGAMESGAEGVRASDLSTFERTCVHLAASFSALRDGDTSRLQQVEDYAMARACRRTTLLESLGFDVDADCGACDFCSVGIHTLEASSVAGGERVRESAGRKSSGASRRGESKRTRTAEKPTLKRKPAVVPLRPLARAKAR